MSDASPRDVKVMLEVEGAQQTFHVLHLEGAETLSEIYEFKLLLAAEAHDIELSEVVGKPALVTLARDEGARHLHGIVCTFRQQSRHRKFTLYQATLVPQVWRLQYVQDSRIFQDLTTEEIVTQVLEQAGIDSSSFEIQLEQNASTPRLNYCVQYRESHWAFISRLLEEQGFYYFFQHSRDRHRLIIGNSYLFHPPISGDAHVPFHPPDSTLPSQEHVHHFSMAETVRPTRVTLSDHSLLRPSVDLETGRGASAKGRDATLEVYDFPAEYSVSEVGRKRAQVRLEELQVSRKVGEGQGDCVRFCAGFHFSLEGHFNPRYASQEYLLSGVRHLVRKEADLDSGEVQDTGMYENRFTCIPRKVPFRPEQVTPRPSPRGVQTATVVGPEGEEIYTDELGRVKVQFHWDRLGSYNEKSSCWIQVSQAWASQSFGAVFLPRIGDEVIVDFMEGDPDRPIITGRVYHAQNVPPLKLPDNKSQSTIKSNTTPDGGGHNEIRFEDKQGKEELHTHAQRNQREVIRNNMSTSVGGSQTVSVGGDQSVSVGKNRELKVGEDHGISVTGSEDVYIGEARNLEVTGDCTHTVTEGNQTVKVEAGDQLVQVKNKRAVEVLGESHHVSRGVYTITTKGKISVVSTDDLIYMKATKRIAFQVGENYIVIAPEGIKIQGDVVKINSD